MKRVLNLNELFYVFKDGILIDVLGCYRDAFYRICNLVNDGIGTHCDFEILRVNLDEFSKENF